MLFQTVIVRDHQRGVVRRAGRVVQWLEPGRHWIWFPGQGTEVELIDLDRGYLDWTPEVAGIVPAGAAKVLDVEHGHVALLTLDGLPHFCLRAGRYLLWQLRGEVRSEVHDLSTIFSAIPQPFWPLVPNDIMLTMTVHPHEQVVLFVNGKEETILEAGTFAVNRQDRVVQTSRIDLRQQELQIAGQEVMTADKVSLRINLIVRYRIVESSRSLQAVTSLRDALYSEAQLAARRYVAGQRVDDLLENRNEAALQMVSDLSERVGEWGIEIHGLDLKDVVLPGEMKVILNQVIEAEKRAMANSIIRREETAATRSLANTARLLQNNPTLMRLKELEAMKDLADRVGAITIVAGQQELLGRISLQGQPTDVRKA